MSEPALRVGQKVQATGIITAAAGIYYGEPNWYVRSDGSDVQRRFPESALTPVVEPEPQVREDEICADERRRLAVLLRAHVKTLSTFTADKEATVLLCALMLELSGHKAAVLHKEPSDG